MFLWKQPEIVLLFPSLDIFLHKNVFRLFRASAGSLVKVKDILVEGAKYLNFKNQCFRSRHPLQEKIETD